MSKYPSFKTTTLLKRRVNNFYFNTQSSINTKIHSKTFFAVILCIFVPNLIFLLFAFFTHTSRPLINSDYLLSLFFLIIPNKISRLLGIISLIIAIFIDALALTVQIFPFLDIDGVIYLSTFIFTAPLIYKINILLLLLSLVFINYVLLSFTKQIEFSVSFLILLLLSFLTYCNTILDIKYYDVPQKLGANNYYILYNQSLSLKNVFQDKWIQGTINGKKPVFANLAQEEKNATANLKNTNKILLIIAESLGVLKNKEQNDEMLKNIIKQSNNLEFLNLSNFAFVGSTVAGELRELCRYKIVKGGYDFKHNSADEFKTCIPNQLQEQGFNTIALHGASSRLYERFTLYKKLGFEEQYFHEHFLNKKKCIPFHGVCDSELFDFVAEKFKTNEKLFLYWMTLTSHIPYHKKDIFNHRFNCEKFEIPTNGEICRNLKLHTQFFDQLAELTKKDEMKGVEVMIVGDHMPPFMTALGKYEIFKYNEVALIHFKIKE